jgi:hypothetical protein
MTKKDLIFTVLEVLVVFAVVVWLMTGIQEPTPTQAEDPDDKTGRIFWADPDAPEVTAAITNTPTPRPTKPAATKAPTPKPTQAPTATAGPTPKQVESGHTFKPYTSWTAYTMKSSQQYKLQKAAWTEKRTGIRIVTDPNGVDRYCIALGTYWAGGQPKHIGRCIDVYMENGEVLHCVLADVKRQEDTKDNANRYGRINNDILEFIVDTGRVPKEVIRTGNVSNAGPEFSGGVKNMVVFDLWIEGFGG